MHLTAKFRYPTFNHSEVIVRTKKQTNWQTHTNRRRSKHPPRFATLRRRVKIMIASNHQVDRAADDIR